MKINLNPSKLVQDQLLDQNMKLELRSSLSLFYTFGHEIHPPCKGPFKGM